MPKENLNLADLDLRKWNLSNEESMALSYLTPALTRRMQKQLLAQLAPAEVRKLHRTLSSRNSKNDDSSKILLNRRSVDRLTEFNEKLPEPNKTETTKSFLPIKSQIRPSYGETRNDDIKIHGLRATRSTPKNYSRTRTDSNVVYSPDSSLSESLSSYTKDPDSTSDSRSQLMSTDSISSFTRSNDGGAGTNKYTKPYSTLSSNSEKTYKTDSSKKRISRFLRPDFYDPQKVNENIVMKEKIEKELETQKVLQEIRDKRKERLSMKRENSVPKEKNVEYINVKIENIVEKPKENISETLPKKSKISRIARPKSYPADAKLSEKQVEKESKISKLKKGFMRKEKNDEISKKDEKYKNKLLHSIEKKLERLQSSPEKLKGNSAVENTIRKLREQSLPQNSNPCTESVLIKRAVSVEDFSNINEKPLQTSRKSVTKILSLFKKYEDVDYNKIIEIKKKKVKTRSETEGTKISKNEKEQKKLDIGKSREENEKNNDNNGKGKDEINEKIKFNSKLPVNSFRRSLNLDNITQKNNLEEKLVEGKPDKKSLMLDFSKNEKPSTSQRYDWKRNSFDSSHYHLSPSTEDVSDSWSICSEATHSPLSPNGHVYSGDESSESVIDRIKRKSFYTRFNNERKRPKGYLKSYRDLDLYKDSSCSKLSPINYGSLDRKSYVYNKYDYNYPSSSYTQVKKKEYRPYSRSASVLNDYVNVPSIYRPYSGSRNSSLCSDSDNTLYEDDSTSRIKRKIPTTYSKTSSQSSIDERVHIE